MQTWWMEPQTKGLTVSETLGLREADCLEWTSTQNGVMVDKSYVSFPTTTQKEPREDPSLQIKRPRDEGTRGECRHA